MQNFVALLAGLMVIPSFSVIADDVVAKMPPSPLIAIGATILQRLINPEGGKTHLIIIGF